VMQQVIKKGFGISEAFFSISVGLKIIIP